jgi:dihydrolipoamide dehydrogenase
LRGANDAAAKAQVDIEAARAWRDYIASNYSGAGQERWLAEHGIDLLRGPGQLAGTGVVEVDGVRRTAEHVVVATGGERWRGLRTSPRHAFKQRPGSRPAPSISNII